jgi:hypothetical protein
MPRTAQIEHSLRGHEASSGTIRSLPPRLVEPRLKLSHHLIDLMAATFSLPSLARSLAIVDEVGLRPAPRRRRDNRLLDVGQRLTPTQNGFDFRTNFGLDADGGRLAKRIKANGNRAAFIRS